MITFSHNYLTMMRLRFSMQIAPEEFPPTFQTQQAAWHFPLRETRHSALNLPNNNRSAPIQLLSGTSDSQWWSNNMPWHLVPPRLSHGCQWWAGGPSIWLVRLRQSDKIFVYIHMKHFFQAGVCQHIDMTEWQKQNQPKIPPVWLQANRLNRTK